MNLNDWATISENQQRELIIQWYKKDSEMWAYSDLAEKAAKALKIQLKEIPGITNIRPGGGEYILHDPPAEFLKELALYVCTLFPPNHKLEKLPSRFCGFRVEELNLKEKRDAFLKTFTFLMTELKGWNENDVFKWGNGRQNESLFDSLSGGFLLEVVHSRGPTTMAIELILDESIPDRRMPKNLDRIKLRNSILSVLWDAVKGTGSNELYYPDKAQNVDWPLVKRQIYQLIDQRQGCDGNG